MSKQYYEHDCYLLYNKKEAPNIKFVNEKYPNIGLKMKKFDINLMQFYVVNNNNYPIENVPKNIKCFVCSGFKKLEKEVKKIDEFEGWIISWHEDFVFEIDNKAFFWLQTLHSHAMCHTKDWKKVKTKLLEYSTSNDSNEEETEFETLE
ncbi:16019_t:CDS:1, partial [Cetraspora pellucida]